MIFEGVEVRQFQVNNLLVLGRAGSLGGSRRRFRWSGNFYLGRTLGGLGSLGGFLGFLGGSGLLRRLILFTGSILLCRSGRLGLVLLGRAAPALRGLFLLLGLFPLLPGLLGR